MATMTGKPSTMPQARAVSMVALAAILSCETPKNPQIRDSGPGESIYEPQDHAVTTAEDAEIAAGTRWVREFDLPVAAPGASVTYTVVDKFNDSLSVCIVPREELPNLSSGAFKCYARRDGMGGTITDAYLPLYERAAVAVTCLNTVLKCGFTVTINARY